MLEILLILLPCQPESSRPLFTPEQHLKVERYIVRNIPVVDPREIDSIMGVTGCLARLEGPQKTIFVVRWEGEDLDGKPRAIQAKWENGSFLIWHGENFRR